MNKIFEFRGDFFHADYIQVVEHRGDEVHIHVYRIDDPFIYSFEDNTEAKQVASQVATLWRQALMTD